MQSRGTKYGFTTARVGLYVHKYQMAPGGYIERKLWGWRDRRLSEERRFYPDDLHSCCQPWWSVLNLSNIHGRRKDSCESSCDLHKCTMAHTQMILHTCVYIHIGFFLKENLSHRDNRDENCYSYTETASTAVPVKPRTELSYDSWIPILGA